MTQPRSVAEQIARGLENFQLISGDRDLAMRGAQLAHTVGATLASHVGPDDTCALAFPSTLVTSAKPRTCLVVVLQDRTLVAYQTGAFRSKIELFWFRSCDVSETRWGPGEVAGTRNAVMLSIFSVSGPCHVALPRRNTDAVARTVETAIRRGVFEPPEPSEPPKLGPSGRPEDVETAIDRWFAFRRGEIRSDEVGMRALELMRWMTEHEKAVDAQLLAESKARRA